MARNPMKWGFFRLKRQEMPLKNTEFVNANLKRERGV
jgi:hypothetical protein